ncbi:hypothetical protein [Chryseobacterium indoltheticum]|uniref:hypothetical protein n=1 Tax=Chryseobacterium indoltheticum TaxID=254 RepID=UPI003F496278
MGATILLAIEVGGKFNRNSKKYILDFKAAARLQGDSFLEEILLLTQMIKASLLSQY